MPYLIVIFAFIAGGVTIGLGIQNATNENIKYAIQCTKDGGSYFQDSYMVNHCAKDIMR